MEQINKEALSFEEALAGLERSAETLKQEGTSLDNALNAFEEGMAYHNRCQELLKDAKQRILKYDRMKDELNRF